MTLRQFYDWQTMGGAKDVSRLVAALEEREISWCMIGGLAVNHWAQEPMATADVDLVIVSERIEEAAETLKELGFSEMRFQWSINFKGESKVSIQISTEEMYLDFPKRSVAANVHGILMRVASLEDTLAGKLAAYREPGKKTDPKTQGHSRYRKACGSSSRAAPKTPRRYSHKARSLKFFLLKKSSRPPGFLLITSN